MEPKILRSKTVKELFTPEGCHISEIWNSSQDENVSVARARVEPGVTTALHYLGGVVERYVITAGKGRVEVGDLAATKVSVGDIVIIPAGNPQRITNTEETDLVFYCICTPRFTPDCYQEKGSSLLLTHGIGYDENLWCTGHQIRG